MSRDYSATMARMQIEDLLRIANGGDLDGYEPAAIAAAQAELAARNLTEGERERIEAQLAEDQAELATRATASISKRTWVAALLAGPLILGIGPLWIIIMIAVPAGGYRAKAWEIISTAAWGTLCYLALLLIAIFVVG